MSVRVVTAAADLAVAGRMLHDFNVEYDEPTPDADFFASRLAELVADGDTAVLLAEPEAGTAEGVVVLRFRKSMWSLHLECYLPEFYVVPSRRRQGVGSALMDAVLAHAAERGADYVDLNTSEDDVGARHFYAKHGFNRTEGKPDGPLAYYYEREITPV